MKHISFFNISPIQFFDSTQYSDIDDIDKVNNCKNKHIQVVETLYNFEDEVAHTMETVQASQDKATDTIEAFDDGNNEKINMECFDHREEDILMDSSTSMKVKSNTLDILPNISKIPTGNKNGVIAKIPVVLAQLVIPISIISSMDLPKEALEIKDIEKRLKLQECILLQPTNILFMKGFISKSIDYSTVESSNSEGVCGKFHTHKIDIPFECSTAVDFFTKPMDPIENTKELFQYNDMDLSEFHQISEKFFNEIPFCKLLSTQIVEFNELIHSKNSTNLFIQIQEQMVIEIKIEVLQNQPVVIVPASNESLTDVD